MQSRRCREYRIFIYCCYWINNWYLHFTQTINIDVNRKRNTCIMNELCSHNERTTAMPRLDNNNWCSTLSVCSQLFVWMPFFERKRSETQDRHSRALWAANKYLIRMKIDTELLQLSLSFVLSFVREQSNGEMLFSFHSFGQSVSQWME